MTDKLATSEGPKLLPDLTAEQRAAFLQTVHDNADSHIGNVAALRAVGVVGTRGEIHALLDRETARDPSLREALIEARGWNVNKVKRVLYEVACDPEHKDWQRAAALFLKAYGGPEFRTEEHRHEITGRGGGPIELIGRSDLSQLSDEQLDRVIEALERMRDDRDGDGEPETLALLASE